MFIDEILSDGFPITTTFPVLNIVPVVAETDNVVPVDSQMLYFHSPEG